MGVTARDVTKRRHWLARVFAGADAADYLDRTHELEDEAAARRQTSLAVAQVPRQRSFSAPSIVSTASAPPRGRSATQARGIRLLGPEPVRPASVAHRWTSEGTTRVGWSGASGTRLEVGVDAAALVAESREREASNAAASAAAAAADRAAAAGTTATTPPRLPAIHCTSRSDDAPVALPALGRTTVSLVGAPPSPSMICDLAAGMAKLFECSICLDSLQDPVTLPCGHSFCKCCLTQLIAHGVNGVFACPMDRYHFPCTYPLRTALTLQRMIELAQREHHDQPQCALPTC